MDYTQSLTKLQKIGTLFKTKSVLTSLKIIYHGQKKLLKAFRENIFS